MNIEFKGDFFEKLKRIDRKPFLRKMTVEAGIMAVNFTKERFVYKNWLDKSRSKWKDRKAKDKGSLMVRTGRLKRSIRKLSQGDFYVYIGTDVPYARAHNEGERINKTVRVKGHKRKISIRGKRTDRAARPTRAVQKAFATVRPFKRKMNLNMPERRFMGDSTFLAKKIERYMKKAIDKELN